MITFPLKVNQELSHKYVAVSSDGRLLTANNLVNCLNTLHNRVSDEDDEDDGSYGEYDDLGEPV